MMRNLLPIVLCTLFVGCGGGGGGGGGSGSSGSTVGSLTIREPIVGDGTYGTAAPSVEISGTAFVSPHNVDCVSVFPIQLSMTWRNTATGQSGTGAIGSACQDTFLGLLWSTAWTIPEGVIDLQIGDNPITITISDGRGKTGTGALLVRRVDDLVSPFIVDRSPSAKSIDVPTNRSLAVTFSEPMLSSSLSGDRITLEDRTGLETNGSLSYDSRNFVWRFDPHFDLLYSTQYTVTIGGEVEDEFGGNTMAADDTWTFTTAPNPDITPPQVTEVSPGPETQCVAPDATVVARFDEPLDSSTISTTTFRLAANDTAPVDATVRYDGVTVGLEPLLPLLAGMDYEATLDSTINDLAGNALGADFTWDFRTTSDVLPGDWQQTSTSNAPSARRSHTATWTGSEILVWGGYGWESSVGAFGDTNTGGRYDPVSDAWSTMSTTGVSSMSEHTAVFTGSEMIVWGGNTNTGARYEPGTDVWQLITTTNPPTARREHAAVWTGTEMIIWGGENLSGHTVNTGGRYDPATDSWTPITNANAPSRRRDMAFVWTGTEFIIWGGVEALSGGPVLVDGARYNPATDTWTPLPATDASSLPMVAAVWTGTEMLVWNGGSPTFIDTSGFPVKRSTLRAYDPVTDTWRATSALCEPYLGAGKFYFHWTGTRLFVLDNGPNGGFFYDPVMDDWQAISTTGLPATRREAASVWAEGAFMLWGGQESGGLQDSGLLFNE